MNEPETEQAFGAEWMVQKGMLRFRLIFVYRRLVEACPNQTRFL